MDQYRVVGPDGREYGPVDLPGLQQWIREGRVLKDTKLRKNDGAPMSADLLAEVAPMFAPPPPAAAPALPPIATTVPMMPEFRSWGFIGQAWELFKPHWIVLTAMVLIQQVIIAILGQIPIVGFLVAIPVWAVTQVGIIRACFAVLAGRAPEFEMMFNGLDRALVATVAMLLVWLAVITGLALLIIPGIILALMFLFTQYVVAETEQDFVGAMRTSAELASGYWWSLFCLCLCLFLVNCLGLLACCVGAFATMALSNLTIALVYRFLQARKAPATAVVPIAPVTP